MRDKEKCKCGNILPEHFDLPDKFELSCENCLGSSSEEWEKEFRQKWKGLGFGGIKLAGLDMLEFCIEEMDLHSKAMIREVVEEIEKMKKQTTSRFSTSDIIQISSTEKGLIGARGYNEAIDDITNRLLNN